jgi:hypothetical protein
MKQKTALLGVLVAMLVFAVLQARGGLFGVAKEDVRSAAFLGKVAAEFNKQLPKQVDAETELANVTGLEGVLVYNYRLVNQLASEVDGTALVSAIKPNTTAAACNTPDTRDKFIKRGIALRYTYADKSGSPIASFDVLPTDCPS